MATLNCYKIAKQLTANGWQQREANNHLVFVNPNTNQHISLPKHKGRDISKRYLYQIKKQTGINLV